MSDIIFKKGMTNVGFVLRSLVKLYKARFFSLFFVNIAKYSLETDQELV